MPANEKKSDFLWFLRKPKSRQEQSDQQQKRTFIDGAPHQLDNKTGDWVPLIADTMAPSVTLRQKMGMKSPNGRHAASEARAQSVVTGSRFHENHDHKRRLRQQGGSDHKRGSVNWRQRHHHQGVDNENEQRGQHEWRDGPKRKWVPSDSDSSDNDNKNDQMGLDKWMVSSNRKRNHDDSSGNNNENCQTGRRKWSVGSKRKWVDNNSGSSEKIRTISCCAHKDKWSAYLNMRVTTSPSNPLEDMGTWAQCPLASPTSSMAKLVTASKLQANNAIGRA